MAIIKKRELKKLGPKEMETKISELRLELSKERSQISIGASASSPGKIKEMRRTIARMLTYTRGAKEVSK